MDYKTTLTIVFPFLNKKHNKKDVGGRHLRNIRETTSFLILPFSETSCLEAVNRRNLFLKQYL